MRSFILILSVAGLFFDGRGALRAQADTMAAAIRLELGEVRITGRQNDMGAAVLDQTRILEFHQDNAAQALNLISGIHIMHLGPKNESMITVRGFDLRQVPVYLDGVPVYTPYEGYIDLGRFLVQDLSKVSVSKGISSVLYGPNTMGGAINLVSRKPDRKFEMDGASGVKLGYNGFEGYRSNLNLGGRQGGFYYQLAYSIINFGDYAVSRRGQPADPERGYTRDNSYRNDLKLNAKAGFRPNRTDEYALNFRHQHASKGVPVYTGTDPGRRVRYWRFPAVDMQGVNFLSKTLLPGGTYLKTRLYYDRYESDLRSYDDAGYDSQERRSSFTSLYFDDSFGGNISLDRSLGAFHDLKAVVHYKYDHHREHNTHPVVESVRHFRDQLVSFGIEDNYSPLQTLLLTGGISYNLSQNLQADDYAAPNDSIFSFPGNQYSAFNAQFGLAYQASDRHELQISLARKTRFATMKDRYSYRLGQSLPNPLLKAESGLHTDLTHVLTLGEKLRLQSSLFSSWLNDVIQRVDGIDPEDASVYQFRNTGRAVFYGLESDLVFQPLAVLESGMQYTRIERRNLSQPDIRFTDVPRHRFFGYLKFAVEERFSLMLSGDYHSRRISTSDGDYAADAFFVANMKGSVQLLQFLGLEAGIGNLFDAAYSYMEGYPEEGRNYFISLRYRY